MLEEQAMITFLKKFDEHPFLVKINGHEHLIGEGAPTFTVNFKKVWSPVLLLHLEKLT